MCNALGRARVNKIYGDTSRSRLATSIVKRPLRLRSVCVRNKRKVVPSRGTFNELSVLCPKILKKDCHVHGRRHSLNARTDGAAIEKSQTAFGRKTHRDRGISGAAFSGSTGLTIERGSSASCRFLPRISSVHDYERIRNRNWSQNSASPYRRSVDAVSALNLMEEAIRQYQPAMFESGAGPKSFLNECRLGFHDDYISFWPAHRAPHCRRGQKYNPRRYSRPIPSLPLDHNDRRRATLCGCSANVASGASSRA
jgi:hypothetical protein